MLARNNKTYLTELEMLAERGWITNIIISGEFITARYGYCDGHVKNSNIFNHVQKCKCMPQNYSYFPNGDEFVRFNSEIPSRYLGTRMSENEIFWIPIKNQYSNIKAYFALDWCCVCWVVVDGGWAEENLTPETGNKKLSQLITREWVENTQPGY